MPRDAISNEVPCGHQLPFGDFGAPLISERALRDDCRVSAVGAVAGIGRKASATLKVQTAVQLLRES